VFVSPACSKEKAQTTEKQVKAPVQKKIEPTKKPLLWKIAGEKPSYLFGTIHYPDDRVMAFPEVLNKALEDSDAVFTEIPMDPATQLKAASQMMLADNQTLDKLLPKDLYEKLVKMFEAKGLPFAPFGRFKLWAVTVQLVLLDRLMEMATKQAMDVVIYNRAQTAKKTVGGIETLKEQLQIFDTLTLDEQIRMLKITIEYLEKSKKEGKDPIEVVIKAYLSGDEKVIMDVLMEYYDPTDPLEKKLMQSLFYDRNVRMSERILKKLQQHKGKSVFFAIGAGHYAGPEGIIALLKKKGLKIERLVEK
jgi:uncharacterized protein YbaP (TraB family)